MSKADKTDPDRLMKSPAEQGDGRARTGKVT
jgi:hypothetical protein